MRIGSWLRHWLLQRGDGFLLPLVVLAFFWQLGTPALFDLDEGAFSAATWEMLQRGDFITTFLNGEPRFDKPILIYWLQAASVSVFGLQEWSLRLPSALAASAWVINTYYFAKSRLPQRSAILVAVMLACSAMVVVVGRAATADAVLNLLIALTLFDVWRYRENPRRAVLLRVFAWLGLGFLCKGPIAVIIPFAVSGFLYLSQRQWRAWLRAVFDPYGIALFLAIALPWYILEYQAQGQAFIDGFFLKHNISRFTDTMESHGGHVWYYLVALPLIIMPFAGLLVSLVRNKKRGDFDRFLWFWFGFVLLFFSFSSTQLPHYLLYGITPLLLLLAKYATQPNRHLVVIPALLLATAWVFLPELLAYAPGQSSDPYLQGAWQQAQAVTGTLYRATAAIYLAALLLLWLWRGVDNFWRIIGVALLQTLFLVSVLIPVVAYIQQTPVKEAARFARHYLSDATIVMQRANMPSFTTYRERITPQRAPALGEYVFSKAGALQPAADYLPVFQQGGIVIAKRVKAP